MNNGQWRSQRRGRSLGKSRAEWKQLAIKAVDVASRGISEAEKRHLVKEREEVWEHLSQLDRAYIVRLEAAYRQRCGLGFQEDLEPYIETDVDAYRARLTA